MGAEAAVVITVDRSRSTLPIAAGEGFADVDHANKRCHIIRGRMCGLLQTCMYKTLLKGAQADSVALSRSRGFRKRKRKRKDSPFLLGQVGSCGGRLIIELKLLSRKKGGGRGVR